MVPDMDGDGQPDYIYPGYLDSDNLSRGYCLICLSGGGYGGTHFSVKNPDGRYIHRCQFPDDEFGSRSKFGRNEWVVIDQKNYSHDIYKGMGYFGNVKDPGTFRVVYYEYFIFGPLKGKLHIKVEQCNSN